MNEGGWMVYVFDTRILCGRSFHFFVKFSVVNWRLLDKARSQGD